MADKRTPDQIWEGDLFNRKDEAGSLIAYIESIWDRNISREDARSYTIAVDAGYGEGKTFFLKRLAEHLEINHPVAFVDAWQDDIADEPLTALAATLKKALGPLIQESETVKSKFDHVMEKTGRVATIAAKGVLRKAASLAISTQAVAGIEVIISELPESSREAIESGTDDIVDDIAGALKNPSKLMTSRIEEFEAGIKAVQDLKDSLEALVEVIKEKYNTYPPIIIIIDELDRCRPTYSVKLLEEIKHLFDVPGIVFILGMYGDQLSNSISAAYGTNFDGKSYLRRFINRRYSLKTPDLKPLVRSIITQSGYDIDAFSFSNEISIESHQYHDSDYIIGLYLSASGLTARDAFSVLDMLLTACPSSEHSAQLAA